MGLDQEETAHVSGAETDEQHCGGGGFLGMTGSVGEAGFVSTWSAPVELEKTHVQENTIGVSGWKIWSIKYTAMSAWLLSRGKA